MPTPVCAIGDIGGPEIQAQNASFAASILQNYASYERVLLNCQTSSTQAVSAKLGGWLGELHQPYLKLG